MLWARDAYGGRFAATAPFPAPEADAAQRWYLWDIDACGVDAFTVYGGYFADPETALETWREGVGAVAGAQATWAEADDPTLLALLMPGDLGMFEPAGENAGQFAEYHRCRRLADEVRASLGDFEIPDAPVRSGSPGATEAGRRFTAWLAERRPDAPITDDRAEASSGRGVERRNRNARTCGRIRHRVPARPWQRSAGWSEDSASPLDRPGRRMLRPGTGARKADAAVGASYSGCPSLANRRTAERTARVMSAQ